MSVVASYILQGGRIEPYVSLNEVKYSPTASALDLSDLIPNANQSGQDRALYELIVRASSEVDNICFGKYGTLNATLNTDSGRYRMDRKGRFRIHPDFSPIIAVTGFAFGAVMGALNTLTVGPGNVSVERDEILVQAWGGSGTQSIAGPDALSWIASPTNYDDEFYCQWTYVNGWANTFTTTASNVSAMSTTVMDPTGVYPLMRLQFWDGMNDEYVQVAANYIPGTSAITFTNPLAFAHGVGCNLSALPAAVKQACIHIVCHLVQERGQGGLVIGPEGKVTEGGAPGSGLGSHHISAAYDLLDPYKSVSGRM